MTRPLTARAGRPLQYAVVAGALATLTACAGAVEVDSPDLSGDEAEACAAFIDAMPDEMIREPGRDVDPDDAPAAAWGEAPKVLVWRDAPLVVTCGVEMPDGFTNVSACEEVNGIGWYVPEDEFAETGVDLTVHSIGIEPVVRVEVPSRLRLEPANVADTLATLSEPIKQELTQVSTCS